ncbi:MAG: group II intron reverse transcriptase/maturase [Gammaproteobacteria bacterium RIFCSPLOWO2_02_FULL_61_13]|nr:MAG: group II intron reverse transcriptase/maturase [Gammaproteobacteria bacterium RIFCSPLOWO2_02_FULL_61_13]
MHEDLMEQVVSPDNARRALEAVVSNRGAGGIDGMGVEQLEAHVERHWMSIKEKLLTGRWRPSPVRRVELPKPQGGVRLLGIPTVVDRWIQQMLLEVLQPIFEPLMSAHSYGFRPGRSAHMAVQAAQGYVQAGKDWVVDMDIQGFFDHIHHDILMHRIGETIRDKRVLGLVGRYLRAGVMLNGVVMATDEGVPQGGPLSPLLSNIYLDALDRELERRGLSFCRYADDCNIYLGSARAAGRVMESITGWLKDELRLEVNRDKSAVGRPWERKFLGFCLDAQGRIDIAPKSLEKFKDRVRELWRSCQSASSEQLRDRWVRYLRGWWNYFRLSECRRAITALEGWVRRHIRKCFWLRWHHKVGRLNALRRLGVRGRLLKTALSGRGAWHLARGGTLQTALSNQVLRRFGFLVPSDLVVG